MVYVYRHVEYCMQRIELLKRHGVIPIVVFDGAPLPSKGNTEHERAMSARSLIYVDKVTLMFVWCRSREKNLSAAITAMQQGAR